MLDDWEILHCFTLKCMSRIFFLLASFSVISSVNTVFWKIFIFSALKYPDIVLLGGVPFLLEISWRPKSLISVPSIQAIFFSSISLVRLFNTPFFCSAVLKWTGTDGIVVINFFYLLISDFLKLSSFWKTLMIILFTLCEILWWAPGCCHLMINWFSFLPIYGPSHPL